MIGGRRAERNIERYNKGGLIKFNWINKLNGIIFWIETIRNNISNGKYFVIQIIHLWKGGALSLVSNAVVIKNIRWFWVGKRINWMT